jgi:2-dehydro-3-deoxy-D-arabinonate dehydratase
MVTPALFRVVIDGAPRLARGSIEDGPGELFEASLRLDELLTDAADLAALLRERPSAGPCPRGATILAPIESQEVWCSGVTYERSRDARIEESTEPSIYDRIYEADRPELFFKAPGWRVAGPGAPVGIRTDSGWDMAEPEIGLALAADGSIVGYVLGNDMSSRAIEGENPLYLPQAKVYEQACALGPAIVPATEAEPPFAIGMVIERAGDVIFAGRTSTVRLRRRFDDLADWLFRALRFPVGVVLLTGTGVVPEPEVTLHAGDRVRIESDKLGVLENPVVGVGLGATPS